MTESIKLDCSNLVCPLPVAKTKKELNKMESGEILEISGDFLEAGENLKRFAENYGAIVHEFTTQGEEYYLKIEKQ